MAEGSAQVKEEPAKRAGDTEQSPLPSRLRLDQRPIKYRTASEPDLPAPLSLRQVPALPPGRR
jgi:hypothetical protein